MTCASSEGTDKSGHWAHSKNWSNWADVQADLSIDWEHSSAQRLVKLGRCPGWSESSLGARFVVLRLIFEMELSKICNKTDVDSKDSEILHISAARVFIANHFLKVAMGPWLSTEIS